jgi:hypothetical protein
MHRESQPKVFISYAHDDKNFVAEFWQKLKNFLDGTDRYWEKWDDREILVGEQWDKAIGRALDQQCNCCLMLLSKALLKSKYVLDVELPKVVQSVADGKMVFFPIAFRLKDADVGALPEIMKPHQLYWPRLGSLWPKKLPGDEERGACLSYWDVSRSEYDKVAFLERLAEQMNSRFQAHPCSSATHRIVTQLPQASDAACNWITNESDEKAYARAIFGRWSFEKRYLDSKSKDSYFLRPFDRILDERLHSNRCVLLEGHPLAGKTRAVYEAIRRLMNEGRSVALWPFEEPELAGQPLALPMLPKADHRIVWMDEIDRTMTRLVQQGWSSHDIERYLCRIFDAGITLVATASTGPSYYEFLFTLGLTGKLTDKLEPLVIARLDGDVEAEFSDWYQRHYGEPLPPTFDHHPGSLFLDLEAMKKRWQEMQKFADKHQRRIDVELARDILRVLLVFYACGQFGAGGKFDENSIRYYLTKKAERRPAVNAMGWALKNANLIGDPWGGENWESLIEFLSQARYELGFLRRAGGYLITETAYLDYIVAGDGQRNIARILEDDLNEQDREKLHLTVSRYNAGELFKREPAKDRTDLTKKVRLIGTLGVESDIIVWNQLIASCRNRTVAQDAMEELKSHGLSPDGYSYNALIAKMETDVEARTVMREMVSAGIKPNSRTFDMLISKVPDYAQARLVLDEMKVVRVRPDVSCYNKLISKASNFDEAKAVLGTMKAAGVRPNHITYSGLVVKASDFEQARALLGEAEAAGIEPNRGALCALFAKDLSKTSAKELLAWYLSRKYHPPEPIEAAISSYRSANLPNCALDLILHYPYLPAARKFMRERGALTLQHFRELVTVDPSNGNANYALAIALLELNCGAEAMPYLELALVDARKVNRTGPRVKEIMEQLSRLRFQGNPDEHEESQAI